VLQVSLVRSMQGAQFGQAPPPMDMPGMVSQGFLSSMSVILLFMMPMVTMALFSEEKRRGTMELLLTAPITDVQVVLGKFFAAASFLFILLASTWIPMAALYIYGKPASGPILSAYLGLFLYGLALCAVGVFISSLTENQIIAAVASFGVILLMWLMDVIANRAEAAWKGILTYLSILSHLDDFMKGILSTSNVIFYLSLMLIALFLTYRSVDSLRWRA
jgi:ABC-2 type transport system permease protein